MLDLGQLRPLQQRLVHLDGARHLAALAMDVAENQVDLEGVAVDARRLAQLLDRQIDLVRDQEVQAEHVVMRVARAAPIDPLAVAQLVALPGLADGEAEQQRERARREAGGNRRSSRAAYTSPGAPEVVQVHDAFDAAIGVDRRRSR